MSQNASPSELKEPVRPKLAYLFARYPVVSQTFVDNEILALEKEGWDVVIVAFNPPYNSFRHPRLQNLKAPVIYAPPAAAVKAYRKWAEEDQVWPADMVKRHQGHGEHTHPEYRARDAVYFSKLLKRLGIDHTHIHFTSSAAHVAMFLKEATGITYSVTPQGQDFMVDINSDGLLNEMCESSEFVAATCDHAKTLLSRNCSNPEQKLIRVYNGIASGTYLTASPNPQNRRLKIASVGRVIEFKGFHHLIQSIANSKTLGVTVELELLGDGPWRERLETQAKDLGVADQIQFKGVVGGDYVRECFSRIDAFVLACIVDGKGAVDMFPTVITEAMFSGLPVISSKLVGVPEQVDDGVTGILTEPGNEAELTAALVRLATEDGLAARMGKAGQERANALFTVSKTLPILKERLYKIPLKGRFAPKPRVVAFYDLADARSCAAFQAEKAALDAASSQVWVSGSGVDFESLHALKGKLEDVLWLPDGVVLEMEWQNQKSLRDAMEKLRFGISTSLDGEKFFQCARRALWMASQIQKLGGADWLYAPNADEWLTLWLVHQITGIPYFARFDQKALGPKVSAFIQKASSSDCYAEGFEVPDASASTKGGWLSRWSNREASQSHKASSVWLSRQLQSRVRG